MNIVEKFRIEQKVRRLSRNELRKLIERNVSEMRGLDMCFIGSLEDAKKYRDASKEIEKLAYEIEIAAFCLSKGARIEKAKADEMIENFCK